MTVGPILFQMMLVVLEKLFQGIIQQPVSVFDTLLHWVRKSNRKGALAEVRHVNVEHADQVRLPDIVPQESESFSKEGVNYNRFREV